MSQERNPYAHIPRVGDDCRRIDIKEILKTEIYKQGYETATDFKFGMSGPPIIGGAPGSSPVVTPTPGGPTGPGVGFEDYEMYLDSVARDGSSDLSSGELKWSLTDLNSGQDIKNCIQVHLGRFFFPKIYPVDESHPEYLYFCRVFMEITNAPSNQAIIGPNNNKFHFEFQVSNINGQAVELIPTKPSFFFQRPITSLTEFNVRFTVPSTKLPYSLKKIQLPPDRLNIKAVPGSNPIRFQITSGETTLSTLGPLGTQPLPGVAVFISDFASNSTSVNTFVNDVDGLYVTNIVNSTTFEIGSINGAAVDSAATYGGTMFVPKNRIAFPVRFTSVRDQYTNYIDVTHD